MEWTGKVNLPLSSPFCFFDNRIFFQDELQLNIGTRNIVKLGSAKDVLYQYAQEDESIYYNIKFNNRYNLEFSTKYIADSDVLPIKILDDNFQSNSLEFYREPLFTDNFQYLNANRVEPSDENRASYTSVVLHNDLGINGQFTAHYIDKFGDTPIRLKIYFIQNHSQKMKF